LKVKGRVADHLRYESLVYSTTIDCSRPGIPVLVHLGDYWYPAILIQCLEADKKLSRRWSVRLWRLCIISQSLDIAPGDWLEIAEKDIVDALWGDRKRRWKIAVSTVSRHTLSFIDYLKAR
jgi:hypothetical protein